MAPASPLSSGPAPGHIPSMDATCKQFEARLSAPERRIIAALRTPALIQALLDEIPYVGEERYRSPLTFLRERGGQCFDGALFAAMALRRLGHRGILVDLLPNDRDDDHLIAIYRRGGYLGAIAKSNYSGLRSREPVYRGVRELVMSYFEGHFNALGERTLRAYAHPLDLARFDRRGWMWDDAALEAIGDALNARRTVPLVTPAMARRLTLVDERSKQAGLLGVRRDQLYQPPVPGRSR